MLRERFQYYCEKVQRARRSGNLLPRLRRKAFRAIYNPSKDLIDYYWRLSAADRRLDVSSGFSDHRGNSNHLPARETLNRIVTAYRKAKFESAAATPDFQVRGVWAEWIAINYRALISALDSSDLESVGKLLANCNREQFSTGTGYGYDDFIRYRIPVIGRRSVLAAWCRYRDILNELDGSLETVHFPAIGNPAGIPHNGDVLPVEALRHACNAKQIASLLEDLLGPVILEIGGGFGGQALQTIRASQPRKYLVFDLPEVGVLCSYMLMSAFPDSRIRLFGEGPVSAARGENYDIGVFPHFTIQRIEDRSIDLVFNESSFSEMDASSSRAYLREVERICRRYFLHINHDVRLEFKEPGGATSINCIASDLVPSKSFKRIYKHPRMFGRSEDKLFKSYSFLYERAQAARDTE